MKLNQRQVQHLLLRLGFGERYPKVKSYENKSPEKILKLIWNESAKIEPVAFDSDDKKFIEQNLETSYRSMEMMDKGKKQELRKRGREIVVSLNKNWIRKMIESECSVVDKLAYFWHDHFACSSQNPIHIESYVNTLRNHALGNFKDLLHAISKEPAMLIYLNNQQNKKKAPNENFAREVMELFTLGRDQGYSEQDIKEAARAFTGWGTNLKGEFKFREKQHDFGTKTVLGKTGEWNGDDVINILLENKQTANYISKKWVHFFVHQDGNAALEQKVADALYNSDYDIKTALTVLFTDDAFYNEGHLGTRVKSPIEFIVGNCRMLRTEIQDQKTLVYLQRMLGQKLFAPPNVAGWPDGYDWVDSSTLMFRLSLPGFMFKANELTDQPSKSFDDNDPFYVKDRLKKLKTQVNIDQLEKDFKSKSLEEIANFLIQVKDVPIDSSIKSSSLIDQIVYCTSKPEYQLC